MNEETLAHGIRRFLKTVGVGSQREIEQALARAIAQGRIAADQSLPVSMTLRIEALDLEVRYDATLDLQ